MRRTLAPFEHVEPPGIVGIVDAHVVRHEIEDEADVGRGERGAQLAQSLLAAELGIERTVIDDVVAMGEPGRALRKGDA